MSLPGDAMVARCKRRIDAGATIEQAELRMVEARQRTLWWNAAMKVALARNEAGQWCSIPRLEDLFTMRVT